MCLSAVDIKTEELSEDQKSGIGYKFVKKFGEVLSWPFFNLEGRYLYDYLENTIEFNVEYQSTKGSIFNWPLVYPKGFHIFEKIEDAKKFVDEDQIGWYELVKVKYSETQCIGRQMMDSRDCRVIVAHKMTFLEIIK